MILNDENFMLYAAHYYDIRRSAGVEEFNEDLKRFQYLKRLLRRFDDTGDLNIRLIMNHIVVLYNCFGNAATPMLFMKLSDHHDSLKPCVLFLNYLPAVIRYGDVELKTVDIPLNKTVVDELRKL